MMIPIAAAAIGMALVGIPPTEQLRRSLAIITERLTQLGMQPSPAIMLYREMDQKPTGFMQEWSMNGVLAALVRGKGSRACIVGASPAL
jgi:hypothetical protein